MKKIILFTVIFFMTCMNSVFAHTGLESSSPQNGAVITEELKQITLTFETKIEQGSKLELQNTSGESVNVENMTISENQLVGTFSSPLNNGDYLVKWEVIGADGHPIDGEFTFTVDMPVTEKPTPPEEEIESPEKTQPQTNIDEKKADTVNEAEDSQQEQQKESNGYVFPVILGILVVIIVGSFLFMMKRKR